MADTLEGAIIKRRAHGREQGVAILSEGLAEKLDPGDPTAWLYSGLIQFRANNVNRAINDLERSKQLNDNRSLFRSRLLLDEDAAVRSANLAAMSPGST